MSYNQGYHESLTPPATGGDGDWDDHAAGAIEEIESKSGGPCYTVPAWHKSADQLQEEARSSNVAGYNGVARAASKHSNPPAFDAGHND